MASAELTFALTCGSGFYAPDSDRRSAPRRRAATSPSSAAAWAPPTRAEEQLHVPAGAAPYAGAPPSCNGLGPGLTRAGLRGRRRSDWSRKSAFLRDELQRAALRAQRHALERHAGSRRPACRHRAPLISYNSRHVDQDDVGAAQEGPEDDRGHRSRSAVSARLRARSARPRARLPAASSKSPIATAGWCARCAPTCASAAACASRSAIPPRRSSASSAARPTTTPSTCIRTRRS